MIEQEFCPECEIWNKRHPELPTRDPYYDGLLCPNCHPVKPRNIDQAIEVVRAKMLISEIDKYLTPDTD